MMPLARADCSELRRKRGTETFHHGQPIRFGQGESGLTELPAAGDEASLKYGLYS